MDSNRAPGRFDCLLQSPLGCDSGGRCEGRGGAVEPAESTWENAPRISEIGAAIESAIRAYAADVAQILGAFGLSPDTYLGHDSIAAGTINTNIRVETRVGRRFLRINEGKSTDDVAREAAIVGHASAAGVPTPAPYTATTGEPFALWRGEIVSLFPWLPGRTLARADVTAAQARQVGRALGRLHRVGTTFPDPRPSRYEPAEIDARVERIASVASSDALLSGAVARLRPELAALARAGRMDVRASTDSEALEQMRVLARTEGILHAWGIAVAGHTREARRRRPRRSGATRSGLVVISPCLAWC